jgi:outer membrane protein OmpA-like peptidoglycan-associated protein
LNSKIILLLGGILSSLVVFFCLKKQYDFKSKVITTHTIVKKVHKKKIATPTKQKIVYKAPKLTFKTPNQIKAQLSIQDKDKFLSFSKEFNMTNDINYSKEFKTSTWLDIVKESIKYFKENNITSASIEAFDNTLEVNATFSNKEIFEKYQSILTSDTNITIKNFTTLKEQKTKKTLKVENKDKIQKIQKSINKILKSKHIYFKSGSHIITKNSQKVLREIIKLINSLDSDFKVIVIGHTNAVGKESYNKILSQKRAESVKKYLLKHSKKIVTIIAKGYGSSKPFTKNPKDKKNRRVEIIIKPSTLEGKK